MDDMHDTFLDNYDYHNEIDLDFQSEFEKEHGKQLKEKYEVNVTDFFNLFVKMYKDAWFTNIGNAIEYSPEPQEVFEEAFKQLQIKKDNE